MKTIAFRKVRDPFGWMSNMSPHEVSYSYDAGYRTWRTAEAMFQALRFVDGAIIDEIWAAKSPMSAKMIAKANASKMMITPRGPADVGNMRLVINIKADTYPNLLGELLSTGDAILVEDCSNRQNESGLFWGAALQADGSWVGQNMLGKLWMELRDERAAR